MIISLSGSKLALMDEYRKAIDELIEVITPLSLESLLSIRDTTTPDPDCVSIQHVLAHVVASGYNYTVAIENAQGINAERRERVLLNDALAYVGQLQQMYAYCYSFFEKHPLLAIEEIDSAKKIQVVWGQQYDVEQLIEHAIVHVLRHRRQIVKFLEN